MESRAVRPFGSDVDSVCGSATTCQYRGLEANSMAHEIVPPEPYSRFDIRKAWDYIPHWLQVVLIVIAVAVMVTAVYFSR
jgi:hypothetical protein